MHLDLPVAETDQKLWRNTLVQYKGGGYEGCFWEFNYAFFDAKGEFHCVWASGHSGCKTREELEEYLAETSSYKSPVYTYDLTNPEETQEFVTATGDMHVLMVSNWLEEHFSALVPLASCDDCGLKLPICHMTHDSYEGDGGVGVRLTGKICEACASLCATTYAPVRPAT